MKRLLMMMTVLMAVLAVGAIAPVAFADGPGAQTGDLDDSGEICHIAFAGSGVCTVSNSTASQARARVRYLFGVPTPDGWRVAFEIKIIDNDTGQVIASHSEDTTWPYAEDWLDTGAPLPNPPFEGGAATSQATATSATCVVNVTAGTGGDFACFLPFEVGDDPIP